MPNTSVEQILSRPALSKDELAYFLTTRNKQEKHEIFLRADKVKRQYLGNQVFLRGLIELSNICRKDCYYCGIRRSNEGIDRYTIDRDEAVDLAMYAWKKGFGSVVIQSGERTDKAFVDMVTDILQGIKQKTGNELGITLSCGEQSRETYRKWFEAGAHRYLLRIETSSEELYHKLHPSDDIHSFKSRMECLESLKKSGYQVGTGVMIGLPFQTAEDLAGDLLFFRNQNIDMIGMGPYVSHPETPFAKFSKFILPESERLDLSLRMIALARVLLKDVNIASGTALQALDRNGRIKGILSGANVFMPNLTPEDCARKYLLYKDKPVMTDRAEQTIKNLEDSLATFGQVIGYGKWGDPKHYFKRIMNN